MLSCERQTLLPITTFPRLSIHTFSPIHTLFPTLKNQGYLMFTHGFMRIFFPAEAPNNCSSNTFNFEKGNKELLKKTELIIYQQHLLNEFPGLYQELSYSPRLVSILSLTEFYLRFG